ncbi:NAD(P)-dependent oxidoreductase [Planotetraspora thailandica]|uniref:NAD(P)-dependent oxidoreductase n=1 Tax=Planotetraspora thailandica TaxID=487172 RepID=A0A8J3Y203_9ACTN|nr:NAD(P)H-binding protein [Planotetraspora thailandica]GII59408.1 NAD(P)-dependent oxidoreductase [Planotetraspora thailandica]
MKVLVTAASHTVGNVVVRTLSEQGVPVRGVVRRQENATALRGQELPGVEVVAANLADETAVPALMDGIDAVFLMTGMVPDQLAQEQFVIRAASAAGARRLVKISVGGPSPDAPLAVVRAHHAAEQELAASGLSYTVLRPSFFMDNLLQFVPWIDSSGRLPLPIGDGVMAMINSRDIADVAAIELANDSTENRELVLTGPEALTVDQALVRVGEVVGRPLRHIDATREDFLRRYMADGKTPEYAEQIATIYDGILRQTYGADITDTVQKLTGNLPRTITDFAHDHVAAFAQPQETTNG